MVSVTLIHWVVIYPVDSAIQLLNNWSLMYKKTSQETGAGRVFLGSRISPKYGAGFGKTKNILAGFGICLLARSREAPKYGFGMRDFLLVCQECGKSS